MNQSPNALKAAKAANDPKPRRIMVKGFMRGVVSAIKLPSHAEEVNRTAEDKHTPPQLLDFIAEQGREAGAAPGRVRELVGNA
jgi:hypothetical protein